MRKWFIKNLLLLVALLFYLAFVALALHTNSAIYNHLANGELFGLYVGLCEAGIEIILRK